MDHSVAEAEKVILDKVVGGKCLIISPKSLNGAVDALAKLGQERLAPLQVKAGEHLAAILVTSICRVTPVAFDINGGVDLLIPQPRAPGNSLLSMDAPAAFEIKSAPGPFRESEFQADLALARGQDPDGFQLQMTSVADILNALRPAIARGQESLRKKVDPSTGYSRNVFLIIHPFDHLAFECIHSLVVGPLLPSLSEFTDLDSVWVLWVPNRLTVWSRAEGGWQDVIFDWTDDSEPPRGPGELSVLQEAEVRFLDIRGDKGSSPFLFTLSGNPERPED